MPKPPMKKKVVIEWVPKDCKHKDIATGGIAAQDYKRLRYCPDCDRFYNQPIQSPKTVK